MQHKSCSEYVRGHFREDKMPLMTLSVGSEVQSGTIKDIHPK